MTTSTGLTLALDASTYRGSVAVLDGVTVRGAVTVAMRDARAEQLMPGVRDALEAAGAGVRDVERVVCGGGPGSFTSLRIAAGIAKGLALGLARPLYSVPSLLLVVAGAPVGEGRYLAVLDAMRGERFAAPVDVAEDGAVRLAGPLELLAEDAVAARADGERRRRVGPAEEIAAFPAAAGVARVLGQVLAAGPRPLDSWQPHYG
ncbi:MAG TPA: tRNA (adenosine(37)-N6)-threonylcarbamoyltransferase complex dimerization subunit type 1 TsaB, partial [Gemmatimonadaceae bacterium]|nr:tRNA (adenosine(37)-N6)-threonylcarbamoyltransferase complex dimerization subunit type 1 TsaB [Gemmatimonadaceae bacterium]